MPYPTKVEDWVEAINRGLEYRRLYGIEASWPRLEAMFYNVDSSQDNSGPNTIFSTGDSFISQVNSRNPKMMVAPRKPDDIIGAAITETLDNDLIYDMQIRNEVNRMSISAFLWGVGIGKIGYDSEFGFDQKHDLGGTQQPLGMTLTQFGLNQNRIEYGQTSPGMPWFKACLPHDIVVPWGTRTLNEAPWVAHRVIRHIDDIKADPKYSNKGKLQPVMSMKDFVNSYKSVLKPYRIGETMSYGARDNSADTEYCELYEIHDRKTGRIFVIATGHEKFLRNDVDLLQVNGLPFVELSFVLRSRNFWTTPDAYYLLQCQAELTDIAIHASKQRRASILKWLIMGDAIEDEELEKFLSNKVGVAVKTKPGFKPQDVAMTSSPGYNPQIYQEQESVRRNAREQVGFSQNQVGEYQSGRKTAHEVDAVQEASGIRMGRRNGLVKDVYCDLFRKVNPIISRFWTTDRVVKLVGDRGQQWVPFKGSDIDGDYRYAVEMSEEPEATYSQRKAMAMQLYQVLLRDPLADPLGIRQYVIRAFNDVDFTSIWKPEVINAAKTIGMQLPPPQQGQAPVGPQQQGQSMLGGGQDPSQVGVQGQ